MNAIRSWSLGHPLGMAIIGVALAIAGTTFLDAIGFGLNVLPLAILFFLFWYLQRLSRIELGLILGHSMDYGVAVLFPVLVLASIALVAWLSGAVTVNSIDWPKTLINIGLMLLLTVVFGLITEEGIFRGWLWATLQRARVTEIWILVLTSVAFAAWHISTALLLPGVKLPLGQVPVYILSSGVGGFAFALMRRRSGSIVVTSVSHGVWNSLAYVMFGEGTAIGVLGIHNSAVFGPEVGVVGLALLLVFTAALWVAYGRPRAAAPSTMVAEPTR